MFSGEFPRNAWYVAGRSEDFGRDLRALRLFGEEIVFFRRGDGGPVALEDACPHRKLPLSKGALQGDRVASAAITG
ncbi:MAG: Rieske 2Fe-2S domain-containing protein [Rhodobacteraceae bacterium]|nr:Rieske 2Fe-2S domain-containing protein [Paracoccaceae bacterium]